MGVVSGIFSAAAVKDAVVPVAATRSWKLQWTDGTKPVFHSGTGGGAQRNTGVRDWTGEFRGYGAVPPVFPGETFAFFGQFETSASTGDRPGVSCAKNGAICDRIEIDWQGEEGKEIEYAVFFSSNGALDLDGSFELSEDVAYSVPLTAIQMTLGGPGTELVTDLRSMRLVIAAANKAYSSSATLGETKRIPGNMDGGVVYSSYINAAALADLQAGRHSDTVLTLNYSATEAWVITWVRPTKIADIGGDRESADNVFVTVTNEFNLASGTSLGKIESGDIASLVERWPGNWPVAEA